MIPRSSPNTGSERLLLEMPAAYDQVNHGILPSEKIPSKEIEIFTSSFIFVTCHLFILSLLSSIPSSLTGVFIPGCLVVAGLGDFGRRVKFTMIIMSIDFHSIKIVKAIILILHIFVILQHRSPQGSSGQRGKAEKSRGSKVRAIATKKTNYQILNLPQNRKTNQYTNHNRPRPASTRRSSHGLDKSSSCQGWARQGWQSTTMRR